MPSLFEPVQVGALRLKNRIVMSAMTRHRSPHRVPSELNATYYAQRASAGLVISESVAISQQGASWIACPGLYTPEQVAGWRRVLESVHAAGGVMVAQLFHCGRCSSPEVHAQAPVAPSAIRADGALRVLPGRKPLNYMEPRALRLDEIPDIVEQFAAAARNAQAAGFDGVELHGANGFLLDQFLRDSANRRTDAYGGTVANRVRLLREVFEAVAQVFGADRIGVHVSPTSAMQGMADANPQALYEHVAGELSRLGAAFLHVVEGPLGGLPEAGQVDLGRLRAAFSGCYIANNGYDRVRAEAALVSGHADLVSFGRPFISNPDLPRRLREGLPLTPIDPALADRTDAVGYVDYPTA